MKLYKKIEKISNKNYVFVDDIICYKKYIIDGNISDKDNYKIKNILNTDIVNINLINYDIFEVYSIGNTITPEISTILNIFNRCNINNIKKLKIITIYYIKYINNNFSDVIKDSIFNKYHDKMTETYKIFNKKSDKDTFEKDINKLNLQHIDKKN